MSIIDQWTFQATSPSVIKDDDGNSGIVSGSAGFWGTIPSTTNGFGSTTVGSVNFSGGTGAPIGGNIISFSLSPADDDGVDIKLPSVNEGTIMIEDLDNSGTCSDRLPNVSLLAHDEQHGNLCLTFTPERTISTYELLLITQLLFTENMKPRQVNPLAFIRKNNLEKHFTITVIDA
jgi:hypothetical protein